MYVYAGVLHKDGMYTSHSLIVVPQPFARPLLHHRLHILVDEVRTRLLPLDEDGRLQYREHVVGLGQPPPRGGSLGWLNECGAIHRVAEAEVGRRNRAT